MKFATILVILLTFSQISLDVSAAVSRSHRYRSRRTSSRRFGRYSQPAGNKWYSLFTGVIAGISGATEADIWKLNQCIPADWQVAGSKSPEEIAAEKKAKATEEPSTWTKILDGIQAVIEFVCKFKTQIKGLFARKLLKWQRRNRYRMFAETSMARYRRMASWWNSIVEHISSAAKAVSTAVKSVVNTVADLAKRAWNEVVSFATSIVQNLKDFWSSVVAKVTAFFNSDLFTKIKTAINCIVALDKVAEGIVKFVKNVAAKVADVIKALAGDVTAIAAIVVDLVCAFKEFREAINTMIEAINETETIKKWNLWGKFFGTLLKALSGRRRHHYYRLK